MTAVLQAAAAVGAPENARHLDYFSLSWLPEQAPHAFKAAVPDGHRLKGHADQSAAADLRANGIGGDLKCKGGRCGACRCVVLSGAVAHRAVVPRPAPCDGSVILGQSGAVKENGVIPSDFST